MPGRRCEGREAEEPRPALRPLPPTQRPQHRRHPRPGWRPPPRTPPGGRRDRTWRVSPGWAAELPRRTAVPGLRRALLAYLGPRPGGGERRAGPRRSAPRRPPPGTHNCVALPGRSSRLCGAPSGRMDMARRRRRWERPGCPAPAAENGRCGRGGAGRGARHFRPPHLSALPPSQSAATSAPPTSGGGRKWSGAPPGGRERRNEERRPFRPAPEVVGAVREYFRLGGFLGWKWSVWSPAVAPRGEGGSPGPALPPPSPWAWAGLSRQARGQPRGPALAGGDAVPGASLRDPVLVPTETPSPHRPQPPLLTPLAKALLSPGSQRWISPRGTRPQPVSPSWASCAADVHRPDRCPRSAHQNQQ